MLLILFLELSILSLGDYDLTHDRNPMELQYKDVFRHQPFQKW